MCVWFYRISDALTLLTLRRPWTQRLLLPVVGVLAAFYPATRNWVMPIQRGFAWMLPTVVALRNRVALPLAKFCQRCVGIAWFEPWRSKSWRGVLPAIRQGVPLALVLLVVSLLLALWLSTIPSSAGVLHAALPVILFNSSTGSDTAASGAGPATALFGTGAATTAASATVDVSADAPDLSGVATDGSAVIWVDSTSGRQYGKVSAVDNALKTVTISPGTFANTEGTRNWGLGGKRATLDHADSRTVLTDMAAGWHFSFEDDGSLAITSALTPTVAGTSALPIIFKSSVAGTKRTCTQSTTNTANFALSNSNNIGYTFIDIYCAQSGATKQGAFAFSGATTHGSQFNFTRCGTDATNKVLSFITRGGSTIPQVQLIGCDIGFCTATGINIVTASGRFNAIASYFHDNTGTGATPDAGGSGSSFQSVVQQSIFDTNGSDGLNIAGVQTYSYVANCTFYGNTGDGLDLSNNASSSRDLICMNNLFVSNSGYGIRGNASPAIPAFLDYNGFYNNTSGTILNFTAGSNDVSLSGDPFTSAAGGDFSLNNTSGAGAACKAVGYPTGGTTFLGGSATYTYLDLGAAQVQCVGGAGTGDTQWW